MTASDLRLSNAVQAWAYGLLTGEELSREITRHAVETAVRSAALLEQCRAELAVGTCEVGDGRG